MQDHIHPTPPWLPLLNAIEREWREAQILKGHDPDPEIEVLLYHAGKWPPPRVWNQVKPEGRRTM